MGKIMPHLVIRPEEVAAGKREDPRLCPMALALNRELGFDVLPNDEKAKGRKGIEVFAGDPGEDGWVRYHDPRLACDYIYQWLNKTDSKMLQEYDRTGKMPAPVTCDIRAKSLISDMNHTEGVPYDGLSYKDALQIVGPQVDEDYLERPYGCDWDDDSVERKYYCHCMICITHRKANEIELEADLDFYDEDQHEGWDEGRMCG